TVEFQKHDLSHVHIILWLDESAKLKTPSLVDKFISIELPDPTINPVRDDVVTKFMLHGPCRDAHP
ncbi:hypothetical protein LINGRAHAP2_LOCUS9306, partial [Linum grandiflorum]